MQCYRFRYETGDESTGEVGMGKTPTSLRLEPLLLEDRLGLLVRKLHSHCRNIFTFCGSMDEDIDMAVNYLCIFLWQQSRWLLPLLRRGRRDGQISTGRGSAFGRYLPSIRKNNFRGAFECHVVHSRS